VPTSPPHLLTRAEATGFRETSLHADVMAFLAALAAKPDPRLRITSFGTTPEGRDLPLAVLSSRGLHTPAAAAAAGIPVVLVLCGIHAGEVEGKEAGLMLARDLLAGLDDGLLDRLTLVLVPLFNPDGNDRIDPANRRLDVAHCEGQDGPASGVGTRTNAAGINLNRDYLRQEAAEMRLLARNVWLAWNPHLTIDCHATDGSVHRYALTYDAPHTVESGRIEPIRFVRDSFLPVVRERLRARTALETSFYGNFVADEGGAGEGWITYTHHPRFGSNYRGLTGRCDILAETCSYLPFAERVAATYEFVREALLLAAERGAAITELVAGAGRPPDRVAVRYRLEAFSDPVPILTREPRRLDGAPAEVVIPYFGRFAGTEVVDRPWAYLVPEGIAARLEGHGLRVDRLDRARPAALEVATITATARGGARRILEAAAAGESEIAAEYCRQARTLPAGSCLVPTAERLGAVAVYLCEAESDDGAVACGFLAEPAAGDEFPIARVVEPVG
jgi:hypothetical protein